MPKDGQALKDLNHTLTSVENELLQRKADDMDAWALKVGKQIDQLAADGVVTTCDADCPDEPEGEAGGDGAGE